jgi:hypothetical protein
MSFDENHRLATRFEFVNLSGRDAFATLVRDRVKLDLRNWVDILSTSWKDVLRHRKVLFRGRDGSTSYLWGLALYARSPAAAI